MYNFISFNAISFNLILFILLYFKPMSQILVLLKQLPGQIADRQLGSLWCHRQGSTWKEKDEKWSFIPSVVQISSAVIYNCTLWKCLFWRGGAAPGSRDGDCPPVPLCPWDQGLHLDSFLVRDG